MVEIRMKISLCANELYISKKWRQENPFSRCCQRYTPLKNKTKLK